MKAVWPQYTDSILPRDFPRLEADWSWQVLPNYELRRFTLTGQREVLEQQQCASSIGPGTACIQAASTFEASATATGASTSAPAAGSALVAGLARIDTKATSRSLDAEGR